ncbi:MAG: 50S ribosomal protein L30 [Nitrospinota bacterium]
MARTLKITLRRSPVGRQKGQRAVVRGLGLRRLHQSVVREDTPAIRGMVFKVQHLVEVEEQE